MFVCFFFFFLNVSKESLCSHRYICEGRSHHEVEDPGLLLKNIGRREHHPNGGQDEEEKWRKEGKEGFIKAAVL